MADTYRVRNPKAEASLRELGNLIGKMLTGQSDDKTKYGFALFITSEDLENDEGAVFYISDRDRSDIVTMVREWCGINTQ